MRILPPDLRATRATFADWLELRALTNARRQVNVSEVRSIVRRAADDRMKASELDADAPEETEPEVTEQIAEDFEARFSEELEYRAELLGECYPFQLATNASGTSHTLALRSDHPLSPESGRLFYIFCLLDSCFRQGLIGELTKAERPLVTAIGNVFQICSCIAVGGYTRARVDSFGFPRATGNGFLPALKSTWAAYGSYSVIDVIPHGFDDKLKDGGIDIIAWRHFHDRYAATFLMFVQVASGLDWKDKPVANDVRAIRNWFSNERFDNFLPAICIPFPLWFDLGEPPTRDGVPLAFKDGIATRFAYREAAFGVIFDRGRIAHCTSTAFDLPVNLRGEIDGFNRHAEVAQWVNDVLGHLEEVRVAA